MRKAIGLAVTWGSVLVPLSLPAAFASAELIQPGDLVYQGAFRLPEEFVQVQDGDVNFWAYSGSAATYYPRGDSSGSSDEFPGSIFAVGHDHSQYVSEITVPVPIISRNLAELNIATTLQGPRDITGGILGDLANLIIPTAGLEYLPAQGEQTADKLHFSWGQHSQGDEPSHGWSELDSSHPGPAGPWYFGEYTNYVTNDYLFEIPAQWAAANTPGQTLASGRFREGLWGGLGPSLFAYGPWEDGTPPASKETLKTITPLLLYGIQDPEMFEITVSDTRRMKIYQEADQWSGGAWLTTSDKSALIFVGTKAIGNSWYGFANGVVWEYDCADKDPPTCPDVPEWPYSDRGYWSEGIEAQILFYDPSDLARVAKGDMETWEPQPYASLNIDRYLFDPGYDYERGKRQLLGAPCFDRERGYLYIFERMVPEDEEKSVVHVWKIES